FKNDPGSSKLKTLKELYGKVTALTGKVGKFVGYGRKASGMLGGAVTFEALDNIVKGLNEKLGEVTEILDLAESIGTLGGSLAKRPGDMANSIGKIKAGMTIVDIAISKSGVPVIGDIWSKYIKPASEICFSTLQKLDDMNDPENDQMTVEEWRNKA